ncbi:hypothetical protein N665_1130s0006 [Sinapis alba]|nr:hypothetical protein N665_1130s0006 [Sinapis alba]
MVEFKDDDDDSMKKDHCGGVEVVDIMECSSDDDDKKIEIEVSHECNDDDVFSSSSSFSGTVSEQTSSNDQEADSLMCTDDAVSLPFFVRKKKVTDHWRRFTHPITWRCKWLELKIKELQNQAKKYDKELQESCQTKQLELENLRSEELGVKALSLLPCHTQRTQLKKRRKRKRVEEASSYALNHNLFCSYHHENRKSFGDVALNDKKKKNSKEEEVFYEEIPTLEGDAFLEQLLLKIEAAKIKARNLKNRVDKVVNENPSRFSLEQQKPQLVTINEDDETTDILLSEMMALRQREGKAINVPCKKREQASSVGEGSSRPVRTRKPRNLDMEVKEETKTKRRRVSKEKPKSNATMSSRPKRPNRQRKRGKRRSGSAGSRRRS